MSFTDDDSPPIARFSDADLKRLKELHNTRRLVVSDSIQQLVDKITKNWGTEYAIFYFAQVLRGESTIEETLADLLSLDKYQKKP